MPFFSVRPVDAPIQSMDNRNPLGFCDVIRQFNGRRQLIIPTHSRELYGLLMNKLRPATATETSLIATCRYWKTFKNSDALWPKDFGRRAE